MTIAFILELMEAARHPWLRYLFRIMSEQCEVPVSGNAGSTMTYECLKGITIEKKNAMSRVDGPHMSTRATAFNPCHEVTVARPR